MLECASPLAPLMTRRIPTVTESGTGVPQSKTRSDFGSSAAMAMRLVLTRQLSPGDLSRDYVSPRCSRQRGDWRQRGQVKSYFRNDMIDG